MQEDDQKPAAVVSDPTKDVERPPGLLDPLASWGRLNESLPEIEDMPAPSDPIANEDEPGLADSRFATRAAEKATSRALDEARLARGEITRTELSKINGGNIRKHFKAISRKARIGVLSKRAKK
jgi:hypothetical protein